jgi:hypothetical protein
MSSEGNSDSATPVLLTLILSSLFQSGRQYTRLTEGRWRVYTAAPTLRSCPNGVATAQIAMHACDMQLGALGTYLYAWRNELFVL